LEKRLDVPAEQLGGRWIEVAPPGSATTIALVPVRPVPVPVRPVSATGGETEIRLTTMDAASLREDLRVRGVEVGDLLLWEGAPPMFAFRDPDGNGLEIVES
jgi:catechol 2,3-dioxygenase-like lactoylglutathione lyase family enzyme